MNYVSFKNFNDYLSDSIHQIFNTSNAIINNGPINLWNMHYSKAFLTRIRLTWNPTICFFKWLSSSCHTWYITSWKLLSISKNHYPYHMTHIELFKDHIILAISNGTCHMGRYLPSKLGSKHAYSEASVIFSWNSFKYSKSVSAIVLEHAWHSASLSVSNTYGEHDWPHDWPADDAVILVSPIGVIPFNMDHRTFVLSSVRWFMHCSMIPGPWNRQLDNVVP